MKFDFVLQPGNSFVSGQWKNSTESGYPDFQRGITPSLTIGAMAEIQYQGKHAKKIVFDQMFDSWSFIGNNFHFQFGALYSIGGQLYRTQSQGDREWQHDLRLQYIRAPFNIEIIRGNSNETQMVFSSGIYLGYLTYYKEVNVYDQASLRTTLIASGDALSKTSYVEKTTGHVSAIYAFQSKPYQSLDLGGMIGVGIQKKLDKKTFLEVMLVGERGLTDIKNTASSYTDGMNSYSYFENNINTEFHHYNSALSVKVTLKKVLDINIKKKGYSIKPGRTS